MFRLFYIAAGGALGALARHGVSGWAQNLGRGAFPWGTLCVNATGSLLIGLLFGLSELTSVPPAARLLLAVGFLGAFTTFSTYSLETLNLLRDKETLLAFANVGLNNLLAVASVFAGYLLSRFVITLLK